jgi:hypothetical protein
MSVVSKARCFSSTVIIVERDEVLSDSFVEEKSRLVLGKRVLDILVDCA